MLATACFLKCENKEGFQGGVGSHRPNHSKLQLHQITSLQLGLLTHCVCVTEYIEHTHTHKHTQPSFYDVSGLLFLSPPFKKAPATSQVRPWPIRGSLVESISLSLSLPVCLSLEPSLSALTLCHLTAVPPNQALKGNFKRLARQKKKKYSMETDTAVRTGDARPFHLNHRPGSSIT